MSLVKIGLALDIIGVFIIGLESLLKTRGTSRESIIVGHGINELLLSLLSVLGYLLVLIGFILQFTSST